MFWRLRLLKSHLVVAGRLAPRGPANGRPVTKTYELGLKKMPFAIQKEFLNFRDTFRTDEGSTVIAFLCLGGNSTTCAWEGADCHRAAVFAGFGCKERSAPSRTHVVLFSSVEFLNSYDNRFVRRIFLRFRKSWTSSSICEVRGRTEFPCGHHSRRSTVDPTESAEHAFHSLSHRQINTNQRNECAGDTSQSNLVPVNDS